MFHKIKAVSPLPDFRICVQFAEGVTKIYNIEPLFSRWESFQELKDHDLFSKVEVEVGG